MSQEYMKSLRFGISVIQKIGSCEKTTVEKLEAVLEPS